MTTRSHAATDISKREVKEEIGGGVDLTQTSDTGRTSESNSQELYVTPSNTMKAGMRINSPDELNTESKSQKRRRATRF